jgi:myo-inositol-1(or 4)-monophosphatase
MNNALEFTTDLAQKTGEMLLGYYQNPDTRTRYKEDRTLLTEADLAADKMINQALTSAYPDDHILSEELDTTYPKDIAGCTWAIDPIDGTTNFSQGIHYWGISIARIREGRPDLAVLYFPVIDELYTAVAGQGAKLNGHTLHVSRAANQPVSFFTCDSRTYTRYQVRIRYKPRILGSAAYNFCAVAKSASVIGLETTPKIWDIAASWLVLTEAGGVLQALDETPFPMVPGYDYRGINFPVLGAVSQNQLEKALQNIKPQKKE